MDMTTSARPRRLQPWLLLAVIGIVAVLVGCGDDGQTIIDSGPGSTASSTSDPMSTDAGGGGGEVVESEVVVLAEGADVDPEGRGPGLIVDGVGLQAFAGRFFSANEAAAATVEQVDDASGLDGLVLVGGVVAVGCSVLDDVELRQVGDDLRLEPVRAAPESEPVECVRPITTVAVVSIDRSRLPDEPTIAGEAASSPVGPGEVVAFASLGQEAAPMGTEVRSLDELEALLVGIDGAPAVEELALAEADPAVRRFAFVAGGCQAVTAEVVIAGDEIAAAASQRVAPGQQVECEALSPYLVVADVSRTASEGLRPAS